MGYRGKLCELLQYRTVMPLLLFLAVLCFYSVLMYQYSVSVEQYLKNRAYSWATANIFKVDGAKTKNFNLFLNALFIISNSTGTCV